ncbi:hypothetical protein ABPH35_10230 [Streptococcus sp. ZJ93]|uniref:hypothetical protein n=1 Tax=Streptococcus handemini TaxID=3161188 RepID=UPI0032EC581A
MNNEELTQYYKEFGEAMKNSAAKLQDTTTKQTPEEHDPYNWYNDLEEKIRRNREEKEKRSIEAREKLRQKAINKRNRDQQLFHKALEKSHSETIAKREKEIEEKKAKIAEQIEEEYEYIHGIRTEKTKNFYKSILNELNEQLKNN